MRIIYRYRQIVIVFVCRLCFIVCCMPHARCPSVCFFDILFCMAIYFLCRWHTVDGGSFVLLSVTFRGSYTTRRRIPHSDSVVFCLVFIYTIVAAAAVRSCSFVRVFSPSCSKGYFKVKYTTVPSFSLLPIAVLASRYRRRPKNAHRAGHWISIKKKRKERKTIHSSAWHGCTLNELFSTTYLRKTIKKINKLRTFCKATTQRNFSETGKWCMWWEEMLRNFLKIFIGVIFMAKFGDI